VEAGVMRGNLDWVGTRDYLWNVFQGMGLPGAMIADAFTGGHATQRIVAEGGIGTRLGAVFTGVALGGAAWRYGPAAWRAANDALSATMIRGQLWLTQNPSAARWLLGATGLAELSDDILLRMAALCGDTTSQGFVQLGLSAGPSPLGDLLAAGMILSSRPGRFLAPDGGGGGGGFFKQPRRLINATTVDRYLKYDSENNRFQAMGVIDADNMLDITLRTELDTGERTPLFRGTDEFRNIERFFHRRMAGIKGNWQYGTNLDEFNQNLQNGMSFSDAARSTWTGRRAAELGYTDVSYDPFSFSGTFGHYTQVKFYFTKP
jgi:hypothetical protein